MLHTSVMHAVSHSPTRKPCPLTYIMNLQNNTLIFCTVHPDVYTVYTSGCGSKLGQPAAPAVDLSCDSDCGWVEGGEIAVVGEEELGGRQENGVYGREGA
jgi:hypothetical protein